MSKKLIRFDWAMKKMLRHKANFDIVEGFLSELLGYNVQIRQILESEANKETEDDKFNRVDILIENAKGELIIIEIQSTQEYDYFHRILFGVSKSIAEHMKESHAYAQVKKVISITIAYFDLGQGDDYVYHGTTQFKGLHGGEILGLSPKQQQAYNQAKVYEIFPEYWIIKTGKFRNKIKDTLDEWVYFLKHAKIKDSFRAKGIQEANEKLDSMKLSDEERKKYNAYLNHLHSIASRNHTIEIDAQEIIDKTKRDAVLGFHGVGVSPENIAIALQLSLEKVEAILKKYDW
jgi:predicted transposase/invertase (TIGR01784 family)